VQSASRHHLPGDFQFDTDEYRHNPYPLYRELRERAPLHFLRGQWLVSRHADVTEILGDPRFAYASSGPVGHGEDWESLIAETSRENLIHRIREKCSSLGRMWIFGRNPPDHTRLRGVLRAPFGRDKLPALAQRAQAIADGLLDKLKRVGQFDVGFDFAFPLTLQVITSILGIPESPVLMRRWGRDLSASLSADREPIDTERALVAIAGMAELLRKATAAEGGLLEALRGASARGEISNDEVLSNAAALLVAGHITTEITIATGVYLLLKHPEQMELLRDDPSLAGRAVEEILRYEAPLQRVRRVATNDVDINGVTIKKGQWAVLLIGSANRDPELVSDPDRFDITRQPSQHVSFAYGMHFCMGAAVARMEATIALQSLVRDFPRLRLQSEPQWQKRGVFHALEAVPVIAS
jgi:pimeloyl-[acyl-carrier protein] synthase